MTRYRSRSHLAAAVLAIGLLLPSAAGAQGRWALFPVAGERSVFAVLWDLASRLLQTTQAKNRDQMDPDGLTSTTVEPDNDHRGQIDPNG